MGTRSLTAAAGLLAVLGLVLACGEDKPAERFFSNADEVIEDLIPETHAFNMSGLWTGGEAGTQVNLLIESELDGTPKMHLISDTDAVEGADRVDEYEGFTIYKQSDTYWAELLTDPAPLYAGTADKEGLKAYIDFYVSGEPALKDERFSNGLSYAQDLITERLGDEAPDSLAVEFQGEWDAEAGGIRVRATRGDRQVYVAVLYSRGDAGSDGGEFGSDLVDAFALRFAVPEEAEEQPANPDWSYEHLIWFDDSGAGGLNGGPDDERGF